MKRTAVAIFALASVIFLPGLIFGHHNSLSICGINGGEIIDAFVDASFPEKPGTRFDRMPMTMNDVQCGTEEHSFNIAIVVTEAPAGEPKTAENSVRYFGIFRIKLLMKEKTIAYSAVVPWENITQQDDSYLVRKWCDFIKKDYPSQQNESGCPQ